MLVVRNAFVAQPGKASTLAAQLKAAAQVASLPGARVLTDITGGFNTVVLEYQVESLAAFEASMERYATDEAFREAMKGYTEHWISGSREIFRVA